MPRALAVHETPLPGLLVVDLPVHADPRGWFKENWQRAKMTAAGLPDFGPVQHSLAFNGPAGVTRGFHAEPWDKFVSIGSGRMLGAWLDLREGPTYGQIHVEELDESRAVFVPRGVANAYQTQVPGTVYSYLVNGQWSADAAYTNVSLLDPAVAVDWPIPLSDAVLSDKDRALPTLAETTPLVETGTLVVGAGGQVGRALVAALSDAVGLTRPELDLADLASIDALDLAPFHTVINAAAYTAVDAAETPEGRTQAWAVNATGVARLAARCAERGVTLVHYSTDYVFDGTGHDLAEDSPLAPLGVYGQSKAAGDLAVAVVPRHYVLRTSWVIGEGHNFVRTMQRLARDGMSPEVVDDQLGRLTFADELARATAHLLATRAPYGTYHVTNGGEPMSWAGVARGVFAHEGRSADDVGPVTTTAYLAGRPGPVAPRPMDSTLSLAKLRATGFEPIDAAAALTTYLRG